MAENNKHGLDRYIPLDIRREVRKRCFFGCVVCGNAIIQYHHFDPEYNDAKQHDSNGITLLCPNCHEKVSKKIFDYDFVITANKNPFCEKSGSLKDIFYVGSQTIAFKLGTAWFKSLDVIQFDNNPLISFRPPEFEGGPFQLNATLYDKTGKELLCIQENEWITGVDHFDIETTSNELTIREKLGEIKLRLSHVANKEISVNQLNMNIGGFSLKVSNGDFLLTNPKGGIMSLSCPNLFGTLYLFSDGHVEM